MTKKIFFRITILLALALCLIIGNEVYAAGSFTLNKTSLTITEGKTAQFTINGKNATGKVSITSSNSSVATASVNSQWLENNSISVTVTGKKKGEATITVSGKISDKDGVEDNITRQIKVTVKANGDTEKNTDTKKSNNANLKTLTVSPKYNFSGFNKNTTNYNMTVPANIDSLKINAKAENSKAKVKVSGNSGFDVGSNNKVKIVVTAENGDTKTYTIKITKLATEEEKPGNVIDDDNKESLCLTSLNIEGLELSPEFEKNVYSYNATLDSAEITEVKVDVKTNNENAKIEITGNTGLVEGENTVNIILTDPDTSKQVVYQVTINKIGQSNLTATDTTNGSEKSLTDNIKGYIKIAIIVFALMIIAIIVIIILLKKENKRLKEENPNSENDDEYDVYKNDMNEFDENETAKDNFVESLYRQRNGQMYNTEDLDEQDIQNMDEINRQTDEIFKDKVNGQSVKYNNLNEDLSQGERKRKNGKHF